MATKSYSPRLDLRLGEPVVDRARFETRADEVATTQRLLDDTRKAFNSGVDYLTGWLLKMHRGAGICREKRDGVWREWQQITTLEELEHARERHNKTKDCPLDHPESFALLENHELLDPFKSTGKSEAECVELADCCRRLVLYKTLLGTDREGAPMSRGALDDLTPSRSSKRGARPEGKRGRWARWQFDRAVLEEASLCDCVGALLKRLAGREEFAGDKKDATRRLKEIERKAKNSSWPDIQRWILETCGAWEEKRRKSEDKRALWEDLLRPLRQAEVLPLPGFARPTAHVGIAGKVSTWNYAMWDMAGQRVRSHLGWVRRRTDERVVWQLLTKIFEDGGWIRTRRDGKTVNREDLKPHDIRFEEPSHLEAADFQQHPAYSSRAWVKTLRRYESDEMPRHLEGVVFGAADEPRIRRRTAKGWARMREKWLELIEKTNKGNRPAPSAADLVEPGNKLRTKSPGDFGDHRLFEWLAVPDRRWLWDKSDRGSDNDCGRNDRDCIAAFVAHNEHLADKPESITFTRSDPVKHPVWPYFGENSAVEYWLCRENLPNGSSRLVLVLKQLLSRAADGSYSAQDNVRIALRGYEDFETSFTLPDSAERVSAKQELVFGDDLLGGNTRSGTLSGMKLIWEREELEAGSRKRNPRSVPPRIYASFSCDAGDAPLPEWLIKKVGSDITLKKPRDGMTRLFFLKKTVTKESPDDEGTAPLPPGSRKWPKEALEQQFAVRGTDLGHRTSSAGAWWQLSVEAGQGQVAWPVGECEGEPVYAVLTRTCVVSLPGDGEPLPHEEQALREQLRALRARLGLNNSLLRIVRLLTLEDLTRKRPDGKRMRKRRDGRQTPLGTQWRTESVPLGQQAVRENSRKAAEQLINWAARDAMFQSLKAIKFDGSLWEWLAARDPSLRRLADLLPTTEVPTEREAAEAGVDRDEIKTKRVAEENAFASAVHELRVPLANALCHAYDAARRIRGKTGLWAEFDHALVREISYGDRKRPKGKRTVFTDGLLRLLRKPPVTKHWNRKDDSNNLPHGNTYRGGVSMSRLNFLDDVKNFVRRWSCRPRWPGDVRRVPEGAKVGRCDIEHLDNLREHRTKLIAHADVAQTLGFEQDLRRGIWQYRENTGNLLWHRPERGHFYGQNGSALVQCSPPEGVTEQETRHPHPAFAPAHVLVYEDLSRYRMRSDRPRSENAGLARWSHRRILALAQHIGGLFGVPVATADPRFSSRYCSRCGAPGCRADRFDPRWLDQPWLKSLLGSRPMTMYDREMVRVASRPRADLENERPWVLRDRGTHFVCANPNCSGGVHVEPIDADENAAANIGLRFLRGVDGIRVTITSGGHVASSVGYVAPGTVLVEQADRVQGSEPFWIPSAENTGRRRRRKGPTLDSPHVPVARDDDTDAVSGAGRYLFRDPSGGLRSADRWFEGKIFWPAVAFSCARGIKAAANASVFGSREDD